MSTFSRGRARRYGHVPYGRLSNNDPLMTSQTRVGKQSIYGPKKGTQPPGIHSNYTKNLGGK